MKEKLKAFFSSRGFKRFVLFTSLDIIVSMFVSFYVSGFIRSLGQAKKLIYNPFSYFRIFKVYGFPTNIFWVLFLILFVILGYGILKRVRAAQDNSTYDEHHNLLYAKTGEYGTAQYLTDKEMKDVAIIQRETEAMGPIIGQKDLTGKKLIVQLEKSRINRHVCVFGSSQSGKTHNFVMPSILQVVRRRESAIITDPKGELYEKTSTYFRKMGYVVRVLNLKNPAKSDGWDMLKELFRSELSPEQRAQVFANIVIHNMSNGASKDDIHSSAPELLMNAMLLRVGLDDKKSPTFETETFAELLKILEHPDGAGYIDGILFSPDNFGRGFDAALNCYNRFKMASDNLFGNIIVGLATKLNALTSSEMRKLISTDDFDLSLPGKKPCAYFVITSDSDRSLDFVCALFFSFLFLDLMEFADLQPTRELPVPVNFIMDEFYNCGTIPNIDGYTSVVRSRLMYISIILQDLPQLRNRYPRTYQSILSNCAVNMSIGCNDEETARFFSIRSGETTIKVKSQQQANQPRGIFEKPKENVGIGRRNLLSADEMMREGFDDEVVIFQTKNVLRCKKFPVAKHPEHKCLSLCKVKDYPSIFDDDARAEMRRREADYIARFNKWVDEGGNPFPHLGRNIWAERKKRDEDKEPELPDISDLFNFEDKEVRAAISAAESEMLDIHGQLKYDGVNPIKGYVWNNDQLRKVGDDGVIRNANNEVIIPTAKERIKIPYGRLQDLFDLPEYKNEEPETSELSSGEGKDAPVQPIQPVQKPAKESVKTASEQSSSQMGKGKGQAKKPTATTMNESNSAPSKSSVTGTGAGSVKNDPSVVSSEADNGIAPENKKPGNDSAQQKGKKKERQPKQTESPTQSSAKTVSSENPDTPPKVVGKGRKVSAPKNNESYPGSTIDIDGDDESCIKML